LEEVKRFRQMRYNEVRDMDNFVRLLEEIILKLKDQQRMYDLENGFLYNEILKKVPGNSLLHWEREILNEDPNSLPIVLRFLNWLKLESELRRRTEERLVGLETNKSRQVKTSFLTSSGPPKTRNGQQKVNCFICSKEHYLQECSEFLKMDIRERKKVLMEKGLCYNCLRKGHTLVNCQKPSLYKRK